MSTFSLVSGDLAPDFTLPQDSGAPVTLSDLRPSPVVLYFYPKDSTPGCTTEALDFSALASDFDALDTKIFGISKDSLKRHENFRTKVGFTVPLLSDAESDVCERYGVWAEKKNYGRTYMGIVRTTLLIDGEGRIARIWSNVKVKGHANEVLEAARVLVGK